MTISQTLIVCAGEPGSHSWLRRLAAESDCVVAVDGGANWLARAELEIDHFFGDCDSIEPLVLGKVQSSKADMHLAEVDKDETDFEIALSWVAGNNPNSKIVVAGAFGGRVDHQLAIQLVICSSLYLELDIQLVSPTQSVRCVSDMAIFARSDGHIVSLVPVSGDVEVNQTKGLKWPLVNSTLVFGPCRGISKYKSYIFRPCWLESGLLLAIQTKE